MEKFITLALLITGMAIGHSQTNKELVEKACYNYIEGFYEGDTAKLKASLQPELNKFGFWKNKDTGEYKQVDHMSFDQALAFADNVKAKKKFPKPDAPKQVEVLNIGNTIAAAKVTAWWGIDYILLSKRGDKWMIEQVLWEGPYEEKS
ncbi:nuclear transport factor 2 family protein [Hanstruepera ponticola]|uniref:nuclear transport factor 2 family protein n=1 Tax=Hanstruepera ponticola TaxID=2042995 RepID=UPI000CF02FE5|nr:nuclear transport factor 2 family protein [Hanstruepera ponticola]